MSPCPGSDSPDLKTAAKFNGAACNLVWRWFRMWCSSTPTGHGVACVPVAELLDLETEAR